MDVSDDEDAHEYYLNSSSPRAYDHFSSLSHKDIFKSEKFQEDEKNRVKRPMNAFMVWLKAERQKLNDSRGPDDKQQAKTAELIKELSLKWKVLSDAEKLPFIEEAKKLKEKHKAEYP